MENKSNVTQFYILSATDATVTDAIKAVLAKKTETSNQMSMNQHTCVYRRLTKFISESGYDSLKVKVSDICTVEFVKSYVDYLRNECNYDAKTERNYARSILNIIVLSVANGWIQTNTSEIESYLNMYLRVDDRKKQVSKENYFDEIKELLEKVRMYEYTDSDLSKSRSLKKIGRGRAVLVLMAQSGLRINEIARLTFKDVDFDKNEINISNISKSESTAYFGDEAKAMLIAYLELRGIMKAGKFFYDIAEDAHVFVSHAGSLNATLDVAVSAVILHEDVNYWVEMLLEKDMVGKINAHDFRNYFVRFVYMKTNDIYMTCKLARCSHTALLDIIKIEDTSSVGNVVKDLFGGNSTRSAK